MPNILDNLNAAGEALKALGEESVVMSFHSKGQYFTEDRYGVRIELEGSPGIHGSGTTPAEAYQRAIAQREEDKRRNEVEAQIRAEVEGRFAQMQNREAA